MNIERNNDQIIINGEQIDDIKEWLREVDVFTGVEYMNECCKKMNKNTGEITKIAGLAHGTASEILQSKGAFYNATTKSFMVVNPFTLEEVLSLKSILNGTNTNLGEVKEGSLAQKIAEIQDSNILCGESQNRTFNIDTQLYKEFAQFMEIEKETKGLKAKDIIVVAIKEFMDKYAYPNGYQYNPDKKK